MDALEIPQEIFSQMLAQAREEAPLEACGILAGSGHRVQHFYKMANTDQSADHFTMAPEEQFADEGYASHGLGDVGYLP